MPTGGVEGLRHLQYLSKSMGHGTVDMTVASYYHITPSLAEALQDRCGGSFERAMPEVMR